MELKPMKRMKTRKELNALRSSNGTLGAKSFNRRNGEHNLVNIDSPSSLSEVDSTVPFVFHQQHKVHSKTSCFTYLLYMNAFFTFCTIIFCAILAWFYFTLKTETNTISSIITSVDVSRKNFDLQFQNVHTELHNAHVQLSTLTHNASVLNTYFKIISEKVNGIEKNVGSDNGISTKLHMLPTKFEQMQQTVSSLGSTIKQLQFNMSKSSSSLLNNEQLAGRMSAIERNVAILQNNTMHLSLLVTEEKMGVIKRVEELEKKIAPMQTSSMFSFPTSNSTRRNRRSMTVNQRIHLLEGIVEHWLMQVNINERLKQLEMRFDNFQTIGCVFLNNTTNQLPMKNPLCMLCLNSNRDARSCFQLWDRNRDGKLDAIEMAQLQTAWNDWSCTLSFQNSVQFFDMNKDGYLNESEVLSFLSCYTAANSCNTLCGGG